MSRTTPRKSRHRQQPSSGGPHAVPASDYESDAVHYMESRDLPPPPDIPPRTNTDLNLSVLRRHLPSIRSIISIAANAVVYNFSPTSQSWDKSGVEGTLFVCEQEPTTAVAGGATELRACVFVLNRRGLGNLVVELAKASVCEVSGELIMFNVVDTEGRQDGGYGASGENTHVIGVWIHADEDDTREVNLAVIQEAWRQARLSFEEAADGGTVPPAREEAVLPAESGPQGQPGLVTAGRRLSISDLFGQQRNGTAT